MFARSTEEVDALRANQVPYEIVPGVTAAFAGAASLGESLTERGKIDSLVLTTGHLESGYVVPDVVKDLRPGTCVAVYMGVGGAKEIAVQLDASHVGIALDIQVVAKSQRKGQVVMECTLETLEDMLMTHEIKGEAILFIRWSRDVQHDVLTDLKAYEVA